MSSRYLKNGVHWGCKPLICPLPIGHFKYSPNLEDELPGTSSSVVRLGSTVTPFFFKGQNEGHFSKGCFFHNPRGWGRRNRSTMVTESWEMILQGCQLKSGLANRINGLRSAKSLGPAISQGGLWGGLGPLDSHD